MAEAEVKSPIERANEMVEILRQGSDSFLTTKVDWLLNWRRLSSIWPILWPVKYPTLPDPALKAIRLRDLGLILPRSQFIQRLEPCCIIAIAFGYRISCCTRRTNRYT